MRRLATVGLVAVHAVAGSGAALAGPPPPLSSAPSEYIEVVPTAGRPGSGGAGAHGSSSAPGSALGAAADALGAGEDHVVGVGAAMAVVTLWLVGTAVRRRRAAVERSYVPNG